MPRFVDPSAPITASPPELPEPLRTDLTVQDHAEGAAQIRALTGVSSERLRDGGSQADGEAITVTKVEVALGHELQPGDIEASGSSWAAHQAGVDDCQNERLGTLGAFPPTGLAVSRLPLRVTGGSAGPARAAAIVGD